MALKIAAATSRIEIAPTRRAAAVVLGKFSRVMPMNESVSAQMASIPPPPGRVWTPGLSAFLRPGPAAEYRDGGDPQGAFEDDRGRAGRASGRGTRAGAAAAA